MPKSGLMSTREAAALLNLDVRTVHRMIRRGELEAEKLPGRTAAYVMRRDEVERLQSTRSPEQIPAAS